MTFMLSGHKEEEFTSSVKQHRDRPDFIHELTNEQLLQAPQFPPTVQNQTRVLQFRSGDPARDRSTHCG